MTPETKRNVFRYGVAIDLVILATGVGLLFDPGPLFLTIAYLAAVALSAWKGGWQGATAANTAAVLMLLAFFGDAMTLTQVLIFAVIATIVTFVAHSIHPLIIATRATPEGLPFVAIDHGEQAPSPVLEPIEEPQRTVEAPVLHELEPPAESFDDTQVETQPVEEPHIEEPHVELLPPPPPPPPAPLPVLDETPAPERTLSKRARKRKAHNDRAEAEADLQRRLLEEREQLQRQLEESRESERRAAEEMLRVRLEEERAALQRSLEEQLAAARAEIDRQAQERLAQAQQEAEQRAAEARAAELRAAEAAKAAEQRAAEAAKLAEEARATQQRAQEQAARAPRVTPPQPQRSLLSAISDWFQTSPQPRTVNLKSKKIVGNGVARLAVSPRPTAAAARPARNNNKRTAERNPRLLMLERRRGSADTVVPRLRQRGVEVEVVERWIDAVDEIFRFQPDAFCLDNELPDFQKIYRTLRDQRGSLPLFVTGRSTLQFTPPQDIRYVRYIGRPYDPDELANIARDAAESPAQLLARQAMPRANATLSSITPMRRAPVAMPLPVTPSIQTQPEPVADAHIEPVPQESPQVAPVVEEAKHEEKYDALCFNCRSIFDATESDWCSCLTKERTLVCTNCLTCFCKAPPAYKEKFWMEAPPRLFEKKTAEARKHASPLAPNPGLGNVTRPLVLVVEDDEDIRMIVQRVCANLNYGFVHAENGQDGLAVAREYRPNLILSDAFMPKLDGREMCRMLREEEIGRDIKMVVMTGLYTDTKYRNEALKRFRVDDYLAKPVAITELINLLQRHLEGVTNLPHQEDLHELHRQILNTEDGIPLADVLDAEQEQDDHEETVPFEPPPPVPDAGASDRYDVGCHSCNAVFDAAKAEWCTCLGRDQTLVCPGCGSCFCKAAAAYKERFWMDAPSSLFERRLIGSKRNVTLRTNPEPAEVKRPLILLVEDDENIQLIVRTVVTSMGFGFIVGANGQEGLELAREYNPDLILSDAFMPKLDGREMCRLLKEDPSTARIKAIIMTGLYTDRKYRSEALDYFKVDDYVAKPLAVDDLIKLFKKHLPQEVHQTM